ncbi:hypothetical protein [Streptomyces sp. NRRL F-2747]|nr:hypothetical protein [Streptomyces sp. NRRL F-2747]
MSAAATPDGTRSLTLSINTQTNKGMKPALLAGHTLPEAPGRSSS